MRRAMAVFGVVCAFVCTLGTPEAVRPTEDQHEADERFGPWLVAVNLGPIVNSVFGAAGGAVSRDGLSLYFQSGRQSADADLDLFVCRRAAIDLPWGPPATLGAIVNSSASDVAPSLTTDGHYLFFTSQRSGNFDIYVTYRRDVDDDFGWESPVALPVPINGGSFDAGPWVFENRGGKTELYFASDRANGLGQAGLDIYVSALEKDGTWSTPTLLNEVSSAFQDNRPSIRFDGLEMIFTSNRHGTLDVFSARRRHTADPWSTPERLGAPINTGATDGQATLSANGRTLYFASNRAGGSGGLELYASTRTLTRPKHHR